MKYAHLADLHLGSWRDQKMRDLSTKVFLTAIDNCVKERVDFILFAGDIFNTSLPSIDTLKIVTKKLKELHDNNIPLYVIAGSHDFSPSGKTMIDVLENAGLLQNVCKGTIHPDTKQLQLKFTTDAKTNAKIINPPTIFIFNCIFI
ncbi:MAG: metallophosphoesterase [Bacteroidetes bacterium]|nr:metallophosphoesterase [Bacteroidota bacterium]